MSFQRAQARGRWPPPTAAPCCHRSRWPARARPATTPRSGPRRCALQARDARGRWRHPTAAPCCHRSRRPASRPSGDHATLQTAVCVPLQGAQLAAAGGIPQPHRVVIGRRWPRVAAVRRPRHTPDRLRAPPAVRSSRPRAASHSRTVLSSEPLASAAPVRRPRHALDRRRSAPPAVAAPGRCRHPTAAPCCHGRRWPACRPSGDHATLRTRLRVPPGMWRLRPLAASHSRTVLSSEPLASSARPATTPHSGPVVMSLQGGARGRWPRSHSRTVLSSDPLATLRPSGDHATALMPPMWPVRSSRQPEPPERPYPDHAIALRPRRPSTPRLSERHLAIGRPRYKAKRERFPGDCEPERERVESMLDIRIYQKILVELGAIVRQTAVEHRPGLGAVVAWSEVVALLQRSPQSIQPSDHQFHIFAHDHGPAAHVHVDCAPNARAPVLTEGRARAGPLPVQRTNCCGPPSLLFRCERYRCRRGPCAIQSPGRSG